MNVYSYVKSLALGSVFFGNEAFLIPVDDDVGEGGGVQARVKGEEYSIELVESLAQVSFRVAKACWERYVSRREQWWRRCQTWDIRDQGRRPEGPKVTEGK